VFGVSPPSAVDLIFEENEGELPEKLS